MIPLIVFALVSATEFVRVDLPGLLIGPPDPLNGERSSNARIHDMDGDGELDILLPTRCYFQRDGDFPLAVSAFLPDYREQPRADIHNGELYLQFKDRLRSYRWNKGRWEEHLNHEVAWPAEAYDDPAESSEFLQPSRGVRFSRFLHDLDGDTLPELVAINLEGLHVYRRSGDVVFRANTLDILPAARVIDVSPRPDASFPRRELHCTVSIGGPNVRVVSSRGSAESIRYSLTSHTVSPSGEFGLLPEATERVTFSPVPVYLQPCRLNDDDTLDFAGVQWNISDSSFTPVPLLTTSVSIDGGKTVTSIRSHGIRPQCSFVDVDGDGRLDIVNESAEDSSRGISGSLMSRLTRRTHDVRVNVYLQTPEGFSRSPDISTGARLHLDQPPYKNGVQFQRYREGRAYDLTGDFDGDGRRDFLVHERIDTIVIHRNEGASFAKSPTEAVTIREDEEYSPYDVDGDGRTDIVVVDGTTSALRLSHVLFSREVSP